MDHKLSVQYAGLVQQLIRTSKFMLKTSDQSNELTFMRIRTKKNEIIIIPGTFKPSAFKQTNLSLNFFKFFFKCGSRKFIKYYYY